MKNLAIGRRHIPDWYVVAAACTYRDQNTPTHDEHGRLIVPSGTDAIIDILTAWTGQPRKVCLAAMIRAREHGLLSWHSSALPPTEHGLALVESTTFVPAERAAAGAVTWWEQQLAAGTLDTMPSGLRQAGQRVVDEIRAAYQGNQPSQ
jgi:hypothetical protein